LPFHAGQRFFLTLGTESGLERATGMSSVISASFVLLTLLFLTPLLYHLPKPVLAASS